MATPVFRATGDDYRIYQEMLALSEGFTKPVAFSMRDLAQRLNLMPEQVEAAIRRLQAHGYVLGNWAKVGEPS